ncbi:SurA N-terminal domain-containing protein [Holophaga foetida]|uniref:SurA N-terminal domain-containing protein n=1 Tax=Holophaga foetida TaxID=35839 RepID=UPI00024732CB|nr:SurA N-terminal domain-containing protein [Holophaga foetida]
MKIRMTHVAGMAGLVTMLAIGCSKVPKDTSLVVASVGGEKITLNQFTDLVKAAAGDEAKAKEVLSGEAMREQRNRFLESLVQDKAVIAMAKAQGLEKDAKVKAQLEQVTARVYMQSLIEKRAGQPSDAELKAMLEKLMKSQAEPGKPAPQMPPFEAVKPQLINLWRQDKMQTLVDTLLKEAQQKSPVNYAEGYKPTPVAQVPQGQVPQQPAQPAPAAPKAK